MDASFFTDTVSRLRNAKPFKPFTIRLNDGSHFEVDNPDVIAAMEGLAYGFGPGRVVVWFDHSSVARIDEDIASGSAPSSSRV
ncbi:hypothetical protein [Alienimonas chondri]|uniref:Uncharacterized protein n=1 Tax=Alienimonas chondri TaxID=2681879 RepID=A0ABX1VGZ1_9PLAN|nr:hypothetical protein [Alienimonas chondri]NNJ27064.1 hypothetical protein [Alienimonas chondri]